MIDLATFSAYLEYNPEAGWMLFGGALLALEALVLPGAGLMFGGLAAFSLGALLAFGIIPAEWSFYIDVAIFFAFTAVWTALLWKPLQRFRSSSKGYHNMIGTHADVLSGGLARGRAGQVRWSGTPMRARIAEGSKHDTIAEGTEVWVHALDGSVLIVDVEKPSQN